MRTEVYGKLCTASPCRLLKMCSSFIFCESCFSMGCLLTASSSKVYTFPHCFVNLNHYFLLQLCLQNRVRFLLCSSAEAHAAGLGQGEFPPSWAMSEENIKKTISTQGRWKVWNADRQNQFVCSNLNIIWDNCQSKDEMGRGKMILDLLVGQWEEDKKWNKTRAHRSSAWQNWIDWLIDGKNWDLQQWHWSGEQV